MDEKGVETAEVVSASQKLGQKEAAELVRAATTVIIAKGKRVEAFKPGGKAPKEIVEKVLGPTGNLRAPTIRVGKTLLVGFDEASYQEAFE